MSNKPTLPKGTRDFGPLQVQRRKYMLQTIERVFKKYGFMPIETPAMENLATLEGKYGDEGDQLLFRVIDSGEYFEKAKRNLIPENSIEIQNNLTENVQGIIRNVINPNVINEISEENIRSFIDSFISKYKGDEINSTSSKSRLSNSVLSYLKKEKKTLAKNIYKLILKSNLKLSDDESTFKLYFKEFQEAYLNKISLEIISELKDTRKRLSTLTSKELNNYITEKGLRYDLTVPFARFIVMNRNEIMFPFKRYQMQPVWRADRPQKGRYREFWQCDADIIGSKSLLNEIDLIQIYAEAFHELGIPYQIKINNRKVLAGIAEVVKGIEYMNTIAVAIDKLDKVGEEGVKKELNNHGFTANEIQLLFDILKTEGNAQLQELKSKLNNSAEGLRGIEELEFIISNIHSIPNGTINLSTDFSLARGLSYYTGAIFEVVATAGTLKSSIGGGGRYDNLTGIFGLPDVSGVGISFGLDRMYDVMEELNLFPDTLKACETKVLCCYFDKATQEYALRGAALLRANNIATEVYPDITKKIGKQLDYANALHIPYAVIIGENEMKSGKAVLKNLTKGTQHELSLEEIVHYLQLN